ncbi:uncharacterized protein RJT21DRAFT_51754 [Scheffersomyces amazonensis]|uniref:uncharacterized protein n=1 Tax=Scheffersomyces amazonensis TaxID=1078765 RepID=UPI00315C7B0B
MAFFNSSFRNRNSNTNTTVSHAFIPPNNLSNQATNMLNPSSSLIESRFYTAPRIYNPSGLVSPRESPPIADNDNSNNMRMSRLSTSSSNNTPTPRALRRRPPPPVPDNVEDNHVSHTPITSRNIDTERLRNSPIPESDTINTPTINDNNLNSTETSVRSRRRRRRRRVDSDNQSIPSIPPPTDEYDTWEDEQSPPYRAHLHKYLDLISFDPRYNVPVLRINKSLIRNDKNLKKSIKKLLKFNMIPSDVNLWKIIRIDDNEFEMILPGLLPDLANAPNDGLYRDMTGIEMAERDQVALAMQMSLEVTNADQQEQEIEPGSVSREQSEEFEAEREEIEVEDIQVENLSLDVVYPSTLNTDPDSEFDVVSISSDIFYDAVEMNFSTSSGSSHSSSSSIVQRRQSIRLLHRNMLFDNGALITDQRYRGFRYNAIST